MSMLDLIELKGLIIGVNSLGYIFGWHLASNFLRDQIETFKKVSVLKNIFESQIHHQPLFKIVSMDNIIYIASVNCILKIDADGLVEDILSKSNTIKSPIKKIKVEEWGPNDRLNCLVKSPINEMLIIGTSKGFLHFYNTTNAQIQHTIKCESDTNKNSQILMKNNSNNESINGLALYKQQKYILVGTSMGRIIGFDICSYKQIFQLKAGEKAVIQSIRDIYISQDEIKVYALHQTYITQWNLRIRTCIGYYQFYNPLSICKRGQNVIVGGPYSSLVSFRDKNCQQYQTSLRSIHTIKELSSSILALGGSDNIIQIFFDYVRIATLLTK